jgi:hypothetical protein
MREFFKKKWDYYKLNLVFDAKQTWRKVRKAFDKVTIEDAGKASLAFSLFAPQAVVAAAPSEYAAQVPQSDTQTQLAAANISLLEQTLLGNLVTSYPQAKLPLRGYLGATTGNHYDGFSGELLLPVRGTSNDLLFLYLKKGADVHFEDWNVAAGGGYRFIAGPVLGVNAFWGLDNRENPNPWARIQGEAFALGPGRNIEANASYTWTWEDRQLSERVITPTSITRWYKDLLEGGNCEVGIWHRTLENMATGVFPGYGYYQGDVDGFTGRIEFDAGKVIFTVDYSDLPDARGWFFGVLVPFGGQERKPKLYQSNQELLLEPVRFQRPVYATSVTQESVEQKQKEEEDMPPKPPFNNPFAVVYQENLASARAQVDTYIQNVLGMSNVHPEHPHGEHPGQAKKEPPPRAF